METLADLEYEERGEGPVVYLVHAGVHSSWFAPLFAAPGLDRFRVIRPIRPGYGRSPAPTERASLAAQARSCGELLRRLGVGRAYWVGHSSSCCIGLQLALDAADLVAGLVLFEPAKPSGPVRAAHASTYVGPHWPLPGKATTRPPSTCSCGVSAATTTAAPCSTAWARTGPPPPFASRPTSSPTRCRPWPDGPSGPPRPPTCPLPPSSCTGRTRAVVRRERRHPGRHAARRAAGHPARPRPPRPVHPPRRPGHGDRRFRRLDDGERRRVDVFGRAGP